MSEVRAYYPRRQYSGWLDEVAAAAGSPAEVKMVLDRIILYLRVVHSIDFYNQVQGCQLNMAVCFWYLVKSELSSVHV